RICTLLRSERSCLEKSIRAGCWFRGLISYRLPGPTKRTCIVPVGPRRWLLADVYFRLTRVVVDFGWRAFTRGMMLTRSERTLVLILKSLKVMSRLHQSRIYPRLSCCEPPYPHCLRKPILSTLARFLGMRRQRMYRRLGCNDVGAAPLAAII